jgi:hypothetical protein
MGKINIVDKNKIQNMSFYDSITRLNVKFSPKCYQGIVIETPEDARELGKDMARLSFKKVKLKLPK